MRKLITFITEAILTLVILAVARTAWHFTTGFVGGVRDELRKNRK